MSKSFVMDKMFKFTISAFVISMFVPGCGSVPKLGDEKLKVAPKASTMALSDEPVVTNSPKIERTPPLEALKNLNKSDDIIIEAPIPVLSATMPEDK